MEYQQGFSLIEVFLSLLLATTLVLMLLHVHLQTRSTLSRWVIHSKALPALDWQQEQLIAQRRYGASEL